MNYSNLYLFIKTAKTDRIHFQDTLKYKKKFNYPLLICIILALVFIILALFINYYLFIASIPFLIVGYYFAKKSSTAEQKIYLDLYEKQIQIEAKKLNLYHVSSIYPIYYDFSNKDKVFKLIYQDKIYLDCNYSDIKSYKILLDRFDINKKRIPDNFTKKARSFILEITFTTGAKMEIGFSNICRYYRLKDDTYQIYSNSKAINKLCSILDKIKERNKID